MGKIECFRNDKVCVKSATKLMEQLSVCQSGSEIPGDVEIADMQPFGNDKTGMRIAVETKEQSILVYQVDAADGTAKSLKTGLLGHNAAAGLDGDNRICLFAVKGDRLFYVEEKAPSSGKFSNPKEIRVTRPRSGGTIENLQLYPLSEDKNHPFVLAVVLKAASQYWLNFIYWNTSAATLFPVPLTTSCFTFSGNSREELKLRILGRNYSVYNVETGGVDSSTPVDWKQENGSGLSMKYIAGNSFVLYQSGNVKKISVLTSTTNSEELALCELFSDSAIHCFHAWKDNGGVSFAVHTDMICHGTAELSASGEWMVSALNPLAVNASTLRMIYYKEAMQLFYITEKDSLLHRLEDMEGESWNETTYEAMKPGSVSLQSCYSTELTLTDPEHPSVPLSDVEVRLHSEYRTYVETSKGISVIDEDNYVTLTTNYQGKLFFRQYCSSLDVPVIYAELQDNLLGENNELSFSQFSDVYSRMSNVDGDTLLNAQQMDSKTGTYTPLISDKYRTKKNADQLAAGIKNLVSSYKNNERDAVCLCKKGFHDCSKLIENSVLPSWRIGFLDDGSVLYEELTPEQAVDRIQNLKSNYGGDRSGFFSKISDFFRSVVKSIVKVCEVIVSGVKAVVRFVLNGVEMIFETVMSVVQDVLKFIEIILAPVLVVFKHIFRWLASLFGWNYVLYTKNAIKEMLELFMDWVPKNSAKLSMQICDKISIAQKNIDDWIEQIIKTVAPDQGLMTYVERNLPEENEQYSYEISNNPLLAKLDQAINSGGTSDVLLADIQMNDIVDTFLEKLMRFGKEISGGEAFKEAVDYLSKAFKDMENFFSFLLSGILAAVKGIIHVILDGSKEIVSGLFEILGELFAAVKALITAKIDIPLISEIYSWLSDQDMSLLDMASLFIALPVTLVEKLTTGKVPFSSEDDIDTFIGYTREYMVMDAEEFITLKNDRKYPEKWFKQLCKSITFAAALLSGTFNVILDMNTGSLIEVDKNTEKNLAFLSLICEIIWWITSFPMFYETSKTSADEKEFNWFLWAVFTVSLGADLVCYIRIYKQEHKESENAIRVIVFVCGLIHLVGAVTGTCLRALDVYTSVGEIACSVVEMCKILLNIDEKTWGKWVSLIDLSGTACVSTVNLMSDVSMDDDDVIYIGNQQLLHS